MRRLPCAVPPTDTNYTLIRANGRRLLRRPLAELLPKRKVSFVESTDSDEALKATMDLKDGEVLLLENTRRLPVDSKFDGSIDHVPERVVPRVPMPSGACTGLSIQNAYPNFPPRQISKRLSE